MKKTRINLIINREDYQKYESYFLYLKVLLSIFLLFFFIIIVYFFINIKNKINLENNLLLEKERLFNTIKNRSIDEVKLNFIEKKYQLLNQYLKDDVKFSSYFQFLNQAFQQSSEEAKLEKFEIDKERQTHFTVSFDNFPQLMDFFRFVESKTFLNNFENIYLESFTVIGATDIEKEKYQLSFKGKFIPLKDNYFKTSDEN